MEESITFDITHLLAGRRFGGGWTASRRALLDQPTLEAAVEYLVSKAKPAGLVGPPERVVLRQENPPKMMDGILCLGQPGAYLTEWPPTFELRSYSLIMECTDR